MAALVVDSGMLAVLGFPGDVSPRAVFPSSVGMPELPGVLAGMYQKDSGALFVDSDSGVSQAGFAVIFTSRCVPFCCRLASDARHHGRYGAEGISRVSEFRQLHVQGSCCWFLLVMIHVALCSLLFRQARVLGIMAGMNQKGFFKVVPRPIPMVFAAQADHGDFPVAVSQVVHLPVVALRLFPMIQTSVGP